MPNDSKAQNGDTLVISHDGPLTDGQENAVNRLQEMVGDSGRKSDRAKLDAGEIDLPEYQERVRDRMFGKRM